MKSSNSAGSLAFHPLRFFQNLARNSPWVFMAVAIHVILIAIAAVSYMHKQEKREEETITAIVVSPPRVEMPEEIVPLPEAIDRKAVPKNEDAELVAIEDDLYIPTTEPQVEDLHQEVGDPDALDDLPTGGGSTSIGTGTDGFRGFGPSAFPGRKPGFPPKGEGRNPDRPTQGTEKAVLEGLRWLCRHQNPDGSWGAASLKERCTPEAPCYDTKETVNDHYDEGLTGLALLCFLGAGFDHESKQVIVDTAMAKRHTIGEVIRNGLLWLKGRQSEDGSFSKDRAFMYNEALATLALAEAYGLTQHRYWKEPAQRGVDFLQKSQRPSPEGNGLWGWRYASRMDVEQFHGSGASQDPAAAKELFDSDTSVTGWVVMALKSAQISGLTVKKESMDGAMAFCKWVTGADGLVGYLDPKAAGQSVTGKNDHYIYHSTAMSALGMCIRIFAEHNIDDPFLDLAAKRIIADLPTVTKDRLSVDYYYWYYASLALNQIDGPDSPKKSGKYWGPWNKAMVDAVTGLQNTTERSCQMGGWIFPDRWAYAGGPVYTTAINVLTLEVYYRYPNVFGVAQQRKPAPTSEESELKPKMLVTRH